MGQGGVTTVNGAAPGHGLVTQELCGLNDGQEADRRAAANEHG